MTRLITALAVLLLTTACSTKVGLCDRATIPDDALDTCKTYCDSLDLEFDGVVLVKRHVGCVCE